VTIPSRPFEPDKPAPLPPLPQPDPVRDGARAYRKQLTEEYKSELAELRIYAEQEWRKYRADHPFADNHTEYVDQIVESLALDPPPRLSDHEAYRLSLPYESRLTSLGENGVFDEFMRVAVYRAGGKMRLSTLREMVTPYSTMADDEFHELLDQAGLTVQGGYVLFITGSTEKERRADYPTLPIGVEHEYRPMLATEDEGLCASDF
jgi:hypothetical protein